MKKTILIIIAAALIGLIVVIAMNQDSITETEQATLEVLGDPMDATIDFYEMWHAATLSTTTDPLAEELLSHPRLSDDVRSYITEQMENPENTLDPVLCQTEVPPRVGTKLSYVLDNQAEVHVLARGLEERSPSIAVVKLTGIDGEWVITNIDCSVGESAPAREFSFDREGFLLKSVPPPLNPEYWHLVFTENGVDGHTAPLFFDENSQCISQEGVESVCDQNTFTDATKALVQGEMTEAGVNVKRVTFLP